MAEKRGVDEEHIPLNERVLVWLNKQGYPLEMEVASLASRAGFEVNQSEHYSDPETAEAREIDLEIYMHGFNDADSFISYTLCVECKSNKAKPWLVFSKPVTDDDSDYGTREWDTELSILSNDDGSVLIDDIFTKGDYENFFPRIYTQPWIGYGVTQAFADGNRVPFEAMMSATKAAIASVKERSPKRRSKNGRFEFAFPVVVTDAPIYSASYSSNTDEIKLEEVQIANVNWNHMVAGKNRKGVFIVTKQALPSFFADCYASAEWLLTLPVQRIDAIKRRSDEYHHGTSE